MFKKRVDECREWIRRASTSSDRILVLSGPPGCGKTMTVRVLTKELGAMIRDIGNDSIGAEDDMSSLRQKIDSEVSTIKKQLFQSMRYKRLSTKAQTCEYLLIDSIPHFKDKEELGQFGEIMRAFANDTTSSACLILVVTETSPSEHEMESNQSSRLLRQSGDVKSLLPSDVLNHVCTTHIKIGAVSDTKMRSALRRIASCTHPRPNESDIEDIVSSANGDIRHAVHCLQWCSISSSSLKSSFSSSSSSSSSSSLFSFLRREREATSFSKAKKRKRIESTSSSRKKKKTSSSSYARNVCLQPFHAVARLLYAKRLEKRSPDDETLPPLEFDPEDVVEISGMRSSTCLDFVHCNYTGFYNDVTDASETLSYFSDADVLRSYGMKFPTRRDQSFPSRYVASVASRTVAIENHDPAKNSFRQITGPRSGGIFSATRSNRKQHQKWMSRYFEETSSAQHILGDISTIEILPTLQKVCSRDLRRAARLGFTRADVSTMSQAAAYSKPFQTREIGKRDANSGSVCGEWVGEFREKTFNYCKTTKMDVADDYDDDPIENVE